MVMKKVFGSLVGVVIMVASCFGSDDIKEVKIIFNSREITYKTCKSAEEMSNFVSDCIEGKEIRINDIPQSSMPLNSATAAIISNTARELESSAMDIDYAHMQENYKPLIALISWIGFQQFSSVSPDTSTICLEILNKIAPSNYDKAELILKSQCVSNYEPAKNADWRIIGEAVNMLKHEKNGHTGEANNLLAKLKELNGKKTYAALLGNWGIK